MERSRPTMSATRGRCLALFVAFAGWAAANDSAAAPLSGSIQVGGVSRHYLYVFPSVLDPAKPLPLVFVFHPKNNLGDLVEKTLGFSELAESRRFIAVYPDGLDKEWNGGRKAPVSRDSARSDDVAFVAALIDSFASRFKVDPKRIFATGISSGAIFCYTLAIRLPERIAAIGPVAGNLGISLPQRFHPTAPVSVVAVNGTADQNVPFAGRSDPDTGVLSTPESIAFWVAVDGCSQQAVVDKLQKVEPEFGTSVVRLAYSGGREGTEVVAYVIGHGGHTWPGRADPQFGRHPGPLPAVFNSTDAIWDFFEHHPKP